MKMTVYDRILLYLFEYKEHRNDPQMPESITQQGLAKGVGITVTHVPRSVGKLVRQGLAIEVSAHVAGAQRKKKTYHLTPAGVVACLEMRERLERMECVFSEGNDAGARTMTLAKMQEAIKHRCGKEGRPIPTFFEVLSVMGDGNELRFEQIIGATGGPKKSEFGGPEGSTVFFGRKDEMREMLSSMASDHSVCVLLQGERGIGKTALLNAAIADAKRRGIVAQVMRLSNDGGEPARLKEFSMDLFRSEGDGPRLVAFDIDHDGAKDVTSVIRLTKELMGAAGVNTVVITCTKEGLYQLNEALVGLSVVTIKLGPLGLDALKKLAPAGMKDAQLRTLAALSKGNPKNFLAAMKAPGSESIDEDLDEHQKALLKVLRSKE